MEVDLVIGLFVFMLQDITYLVEVMIMKAKVMIVGAGSAGEKILRETLVTPKINKEVVCFIDDDLSKKGRRIHNVPVVGGRNEILQQAENIM